MHVFLYFIFYCGYFIGNFFFSEKINKTPVFKGYSIAPFVFSALFHESLYTYAWIMTSEIACRCDLSSSVSNNTCWNNTKGLASIVRNNRRHKLIIDNVLQDSDHDSSGLLVKSLIVPSGFQGSQSSGDSVVLAEKDCVDTGQAQVLCGSDVSTFEAGRRSASVTVCWQVNQTTIDSVDQLATTQGSQCLGI
jgi:hypothetical protein